MSSPSKIVTFDRTASVRRLAIVLERVSPSQAAMRIFIYLQIGEEGRAIADSLGEFAFRLRMFFDRIAASSLFTRSRSELHSARFARPHELASLISHTLTDTEALLLGVWNGNRPVSVKPSLSRPELGNLAVVARTAFVIIARSPPVIVRIRLRLHTSAKPPSCPVLPRSSLSTALPP